MDLVCNFYNYFLNIKYEPKFLWCWQRWFSCFLHWFHFHLQYIYNPFFDGYLFVCLFLVLLLLLCFLWGGVAPVLDVVKSTLDTFTFPSPSLKLKQNNIIIKADKMISVVPSLAVVTRLLHQNITHKQTKHVLKRQRHKHKTSHSWYITVNTVLVHRAEKSQRNIIHRYSA